ncbi:MAG TPA: hypothetical protein VF151_11005 [Gemmatimonadales bacterium]
MIVIGIDPGLTGAIACLDHHGEVRLIADIPVMQRASGKAAIKNQVSPAGLLEVLQICRQDDGAIQLMVLIEKAQPMPGMIKGNPKAQRSATTFSLGLSAGLIEGVIAAAGYPHELVHPATWKAKLKPGKDKEAARAMAIRLYPGAAGQLGRVKDHNRAEALLLAHYGRQLYH